MTGPSSRSRRGVVVAAIARAWATQGYGPTQCELRDATRLSLGGVRYLLARLRYEGVITWEDRKMRTIRKAKKGEGR